LRKLRVESTSIFFRFGSKIGCFAPQVFRKHSDAFHTLALVFDSIFDFWRTAILGKFLLIAVALALGSAALYRTLIYNPDRPYQSVKSAVIEKAGNAVISAANTEAVSMLDDLTEGLEKGCERNRLGLTTEKCIEIIDARKDACAQSTGKAFPGAVSSVEQIGQISKHFYACIFQSQ
jgi:hypothetical protein